LTKSTQRRMEQVPQRLQQALASHLSLHLCNHFLLANNSNSSEILIVGHRHCRSFRDL